MARASQMFSVVGCLFAAIVVRGQSHAPRGVEFEGLLLQAPVVIAPSIDHARLLAESAADPSGPARIGDVLSVQAGSQRDGIWLQAEDGSWLWMARLRVPGARWTRLTFDRLEIPDKAELLVYAPTRHDAAHGPYDHSALSRSGRFWTPVIFGDEVVVELYVPPGVEDVLTHTNIEISQIVHGYRGFESDAGTRGEPLSCHLDVSCVTNLGLQHRGVGMWIVCPGGSCYQCTGAMIQRTGSGDADFAPLFLTAEHCGATDANADSITVFWFFETDDCNGSAPDYHTLPQTQGATVLMGDADTDVALIGLRDNVPGGVAFLFIDTDHWATPPGLDQDGYSIYHPLTSFKRLGSMEKGGAIDQMPTHGEPGCVDADNYRCTFLFNGRLEAGANGAPLFDGGSDRIRCVVSCFSAANCEQAQPVSGGRLDQSEPLLRPFIDPVSTTYCDASWSGYERGTADAPMQYLYEAIFATRRDGELRVAGGRYRENVVFDRAMTITTWGAHSVTVGD